MWSFPWCQPKLCFVGSLLFLGDRSGRRQLSGVERLKTISASLDAKSPVELGLDAGGSRTQNAPTQLFLAMGIWWDMMGYDWYELMWIDMTCYSNYTIGLDRFWGRLAPFVACLSVNHYDHYRTLDMLLRLMRNIAKREFKVLWRGRFPGNPTYSTCNQPSQRGSKTNRLKPGQQSQRRCH